VSENDDLRDKDLARAYREASVEQPSAGLDARILAAAQAAARPAVAATAASWVSSWRIPVALAATVLLSFTLTLLVRESEEDRFAAPDEGAGPARPAQRSAERGTEPKSPNVAPVPAAPPSAPLPSPHETRAQPRATSPAPQAQSGTGAAASGSGFTAGTTPRSAPTTEAFVPDPAAGATGNVWRERKATQAIPAAPARDGSRSAVMKDQAVQEQARPEAAAASAPAFRRADAPERATRSPEQWLADIRKLKQEGKSAEAEASLAEFRKRYPQYSLPEDLK
jgi:hypothetical protein